jgi:BirA family biotin operon repressor/biotin-[acetyl-CoA-carboxylase] ligase
VLLTRPDLERVLAELGVSAPVRADEVTGSTNRTAIELADEGAPEWTLVAAGHQEQGRGRLERTWRDVPGRAVLLSIVLRPPELAPERAGVIPLLAGAAMARAIRDVARLDATCKWPNDLLIEGRKVGGILAESRVREGRVDVAVLGVGVNLDAPRGEGGAAGLGDVDAVALVAAFLRGLRASYPPSGWELPVAWYEEVCTTIGREVEALRLDGGVVHGRATGVAPDGALLLATDRGRIAVGTGEVRHLGS